MTSPIQLISTDFDGTLFAEFENPPIPERLQHLIGEVQHRGGKWAINTGRDMSSLLEALGRARVAVQPDYLVLVEREIHCHDGVCYRSLEEWNAQCTRSHEELFRRVRKDLAQLTGWINSRFNATVYEDPYSPFCLIAGNNGDADAIHEYLEEYSRHIPHLTIMRNDVYARFSHDSFNKGTALAELTRRLNITAAQVFAVGDHFNDLPMLSRTYAHCLAAPQNAIAQVKDTVRHQGGYVSTRPHGHGVAEALMFFLQTTAR